MAGIQWLDLLGIYLKTELLEGKKEKICDYGIFWTMLYRSY